MNCLECQAWLQRRLDGERLAATEALEQHWSACKVCREQHAAALRLLEGLQRLPRAKPSPGFAQALAATIVQDRKRRQQKLRRGVFLTMALAASVMLLLVASYYWIPRPDQGGLVPNPPIAKNDPPPKVDPAPPKTPEEPRKPEPRNAFASLTERWVDTTRDHAKVVLVAANLDGVDKLPMDNLPTLDPGVREAGQEVSEGVRAVTRNTRRAFDFFARELPMPEISAHGD